MRSFKTVYLDAVRRRNGLLTIELDGYPNLFVCHMSLLCLFGDGRLLFDFLTLMPWNFYLIDKAVIFSDLSYLPEPQENKISEMKGIAFLFSCHNFPIILYRRFGTWPVAMLAQTWNKVELEGPVCNGSQVIGWHTNKSKGLRRFHIDMSGFAFNSTILWDPKRWQRPTSDPIRQLDTVKEGFQVWIMSLQYKLSIYVWDPYFVELMGSHSEPKQMDKTQFSLCLLTGNHIYRASCRRRKPNGRPSSWLFKDTELAPQAGST